MGEANRRRQVNATGSPAKVYSEIAAHLLAESGDRTIFFGPVAWVPSDGTEARRWRFIAITGKDGGARIHELGAQSEKDTYEMRLGAKLALVASKPCVMVHFDDELKMAKQAETLWPSDNITRVRKRMEAERRGEA